MKILIAEDETVSRRLLQSFLTHGGTKLCKLPTVTKRGDYSNGMIFRSLSAIG